MINDWYATWTVMSVSEPDHYLDKCDIRVAGPARWVLKSDLCSFHRLQHSHQGNRTACTFDTTSSPCLLIGFEYVQHTWELQQTRSPGMGNHQSAMFFLITSYLLFAFRPKELINELWKNPPHLASLLNSPSPWSRGFVYGSLGILAITQWKTENRFLAEPRLLHPVGPIRWLGRTIFMTDIQRGRDLIREITVSCLTRCDQQPLLPCDYGLA